MKFRIIYSSILFIIFPMCIIASSGSISGSTITECNGVYYGYHGDDEHWHVAVKRNNRWYPNGDPIYSNPCSASNTVNYNNIETNTVNEEIIKSNDTGLNSGTINYNGNETNTVNEEIIKSDDTSLKSITINNENVEISDNMIYKTNEEKIIIVAKTNDDKAELFISKGSNKFIDLNFGNNEITIKVIAENGTERIYNLNIYRLNNNTELIIKFDDKEINFENFISEQLYTSNDNIKLYVIPKHNSTTADTKENYNLIDGDNSIIITSTAENGNTQQYTITIHKYSKLEDAIFNVIVVGGSCSVVGGCIATPIIISKQKRKK